MGLNNSNLLTTLSHDMERLRQLLAIFMIALLVTPITVGAQPVVEGEVESRCCCCGDLSLPGCGCVVEGEDTEPPVLVAIDSSKPVTKMLGAATVSGTIGLTSLRGRGLSGLQVTRLESPPMRYCGRSCVLRL